MFIVAYVDIANGCSFVGPFVSHEDAVLHCDGDDNPWVVIPLAPPPDGASGALATELGNSADVLEEVVIDLSEVDAEAAKESVAAIKKVEAFLRGFTDSIDEASSDCAEE